MDNELRKKNDDLKDKISHLKELAKQNLKINTTLLNKLEEILNQK